MSFSTLFPILDTCAYLNTANAGILSRPLQQWRNKHDADYLISGSDLRANHGIIMGELRRNLSTLFKSKLDNTYLVPNFSIGFNTLLDGLEKSHRFLLLSEDYPSVNYPVISRGFDYADVPISPNPEDQILAAIKKYKPSVFAFSIVQYISGIRIDPQFIKDIKDSHPELIIIGDGTQFCGTATFDFNSSGMDAVISSGYKWMLGGYGNGFVMLSDHLKERIYQQRTSTPLPTAPFLKGKDFLSLCFEPGHLDTLNFGSLNQSVLYLQSIGLENIEKISQSVCEKARAAFYSRGLISDSLIGRKIQSTLMNLPLQPDTFQKLIANRIICSNRGTGTRISFHFYNTDKDLELLLQILDEHAQAL
ncbi:aminotransferase class V-fold PLP-dependent enzyme [Pedobacter sp. V48]|uniref:aminotransferase class V-fold PLP-dependent enzyme n=1 Tax=Pedobacter sp. V48 TaxID=509635 RepID=UPI0003E4ABD2|nr:aminotransferase class V-fold PLP-dependent enzyme [Pedobacter sp. V48]ETZ20906.1 hypothetical protein N824_02015 [Pedobacter sp. V48]